MNRRGSVKGSGGGASVGGVGGDPWAAAILANQSGPKAAYQVRGRFMFADSSRETHGTYVILARSHSLVARAARRQWGTSCASAASYCLSPLVLAMRRSVTAPDGATHRSTSADRGCPSRHHGRSASADGSVFSTRG